MTAVRRAVRWISRRVAPECDCGRTGCRHYLDCPRFGSPYLRR